MGSLVPRIVVGFRNRPLIIRGAHWCTQLIEKPSNGAADHESKDSEKSVTVNASVHVYNAQINGEASIKGLNHSIANYECAQRVWNAPW